MLAGILAQRHGFRCTVLFAINRKTGEIDPNTLDNIPGLEALATADLMVICTRFRELPTNRCGWWTLTWSPPSQSLASGPP